MTQTTLVFVAAVLLMVTDPAMAATRWRAVHTRPARARTAPVANRLSPYDEARLERRPWWLVRRPQRGAVKVRGGYLIHRSRVRGEGFFTPLTAGEANKR